ncbi:MAG: hypothetical protein OHK93_007649 [Ramalina farinacea]|uniref:DUF1754-domain-containing protein n=1 Tax=Ramalina farinacea TaxID=258253 RepID=A0AA43QN20_9LECA|nr:hypothetical protein [Ramalina farinacea]
MPSGDYAAVSTGALKLKGVASSSKIVKHKKKKKVKPPPSPDAAKEDEPPSEQSTELQLSKTTTDDHPEDNDAPRNNDSDPHQKDHRPEPQRAGKTEAELRHEERRRKRLDERLKREGIKTHKEKVEELNRYLSNLSEHHDIQCDKGIG